MLTEETISAAMPEASKAYVLDFGSRDAEAELQAIEKRNGKPSTNGRAKVTA